MQNAFYTKLTSDKMVVGSLLFSGSASIAEMMAHMGYDFLVIDAEHTLNTLPNMLSMVRAVQAANTSCVPLVRVPTHSPDFLKQVLDGVGIETIMFPFVESRDEAESLVEACLYPPRGIRGHAGTVRPAHYGIFPRYQDVVEEKLCLVAQIESEQAIGQIEAIGKTPGIHSVFLGLGDLSVSMGVPEGLANPEFRAFIGDAIQRCSRAGLFVGSFQFNQEQARWFLEQGGRYLSFGSDMRYIANGGKSDLLEIRASDRSDPE